MSYPQTNITAMDGIDPPSRMDPVNFDTRAEALFDALTPLQSQTNTLSTQVNAMATQANLDASAAAAAAESALAAVNVPAWVSGTTYQVGNAVYSPANGRTYRRSIAGAGTTDPASDPTNWNPVTVQSAPTVAKAAGFTAVIGDRGSNFSCTGTFTVAFSAAASLTNGWYCFVQNGGTGTITLDPNGAETIQGLATYALPPSCSAMVASDGTNLRMFLFNNFGSKGADIASAATINLTTATVDFVHVTGTTTITAITIPVGAVRTVIFDGVLTLTNSASLLLPGGANITTAANDRMIVRGDTAGAIVVSYVKASGKATIGGLEMVGQPTVVGAAVANIDYLTIFNSDYDMYRIEVFGIKPSTGTPSLQLRFANAGVVDSATTSYSNILNGSSIATTSTSAQITVGFGNIDATSIGGSYTIEVLNVNDAANLKAVNVHGACRSGTALFNGGANSNIYIPASAISGFRLFFSSGNIASGTVRVYGYRNI